jgi:hypothetical protein
VIALEQVHSGKHIAPPQLVVYALSCGHEVWVSLGVRVSHHTCAGQSALHAHLSWLP